MKILFACDHIVKSGFARVAEALCKHLYSNAHEIHVHALGYYGDYHEKDYSVWSAVDAKGFWGPIKFARLIEQIKPDVIIMFNDVWIVDLWVKSVPESTRAKLVAYCPVDAHGYTQQLIEPLHHLDGVATYTEYAAQILQKAGLKYNPTVIGHGLDIDMFKNIDKIEARKAIGLEAESLWIVLSTDANTTRKRLDIAALGFAAFLNRWKRNGSKGPKPVIYLHHGAVKSKTGWELSALFKLLGRDYDFDPEEHFLATHPDDVPAPDPWLAQLYACADIGLKTCWGEGWGLTVFEQAAYAVPSILPKHSALEELWSSETAFMIEPSFELLNPIINTVGCYVTPEAVAETLWFAYTHPKEVAFRGAAARDYVLAPKWSWSTIGDMFEGWLHDIV